MRLRLFFRSEGAVVSARHFGPMVPHVLGNDGLNCQPCLFLHLVRPPAQDRRHQAIHQRDVLGVLSTQAMPNAATLTRRYANFPHQVVVVVNILIISSTGPTQMLPAFDNALGMFQTHALEWMLYGDHAILARLCHVAIDE